MLSIPQYDTFLQREYEAAVRETKKITFVIRIGLQFITKFFVKRAVRKINAFLVNQVVTSKGMFSDIESRSESLLGKDLSEIISSVDKMIKINITLKELLTNSTSFEDLLQEMPEVSSWNSLLEETIVDLYSTLRILKRQNLKTTIETSPLALESSKRSLTSLQTATYDRRAT